MTGVPVLADRVMRARRESDCILCGDLIRIGQPIARCPGRLWFHASCWARDGHRHNLDGQCAITDCPANPGGAAQKGSTT